jgi:hypothetical protein
MSNDILTDPTSLCRDDSVGHRTDRYPFSGCFVWYAIRTGRQILRQQKSGNLVPNESQNLIVTFRARKPLRRRIVPPAHADAAPTGWIFQSPLTRFCRENLYGRYPQFLRKPMLIATLVLLLVILRDVPMRVAPWSLGQPPVGYLVAHGIFWPPSC